MDKRKSIVFLRQYRNLLLSKEEGSGAQKLTSQNGHWHDDARFSWLPDNDLPDRCRHCLFLTCSYRDNPIFFTLRNI